MPDGTITLKLLKGMQAANAAPKSEAGASELAARLLDEYNIPATAPHLEIARAMVKQQLPLTPQNLDELLHALTEYGSWGPAEADAAAALKAAGLPVTAESIRLALREPAQLGEEVAQLMTELNRAAKTDQLPGELGTLLNAGLHTLQGSVIGGAGTSAEIGKELQAALDKLGRSIENTLAEGFLDPGTDPAKHGPVTLAILTEALKQAGKDHLAHLLDEFLQDLHRQQLFNARPEPAAAHERWSTVDVPMDIPRNDLQARPASVRLRVAHEEGASGGKINPANTRLAIQVDLEEGTTAEVDLTILGKQIRTSVTAEDPAWCSLAKEELPALEEAFVRLGFVSEGASIHTAAPQPFEQAGKRSGATRLMTVNIEA